MNVCLLPLSLDFPEILNYSSFAVVQKSIAVFCQARELI